MKMRKLDAPVILSASHFDPAAAMHPGRRFSPSRVRQHCPAMTTLQAALVFWPMTFLAFTVVIVGGFLLLIGTAAFAVFAARGVNRRRDSFDEQMQELLEPSISKFSNPERNMQGRNRTEARADDRTAHGVGPAAGLDLPHNFRRVPHTRDRLPVRWPKEPR